MLPERVDEGLQWLAGELRAAEKAAHVDEVGRRLLVDAQRAVEQLTRLQRELLLREGPDQARCIGPGRIAERLAAGAAVAAQDALPLYVRDKVAQTTVERESIRMAAEASP